MFWYLDAKTHSQTRCGDMYPKHIHAHAHTPRERERERERERAREREREREREFWPHFAWIWPNIS